MHDTNLTLSQTQESIKSSRESEKSGFENIGKFYKHLRKVSKVKKLKSIDKEIYMMMVEYSFGYMNNIKLEIQISNKQLMEECGVADKTITNSMNRLLDSGLISRVKWQHVGPKQVYKYKVAFPNDYTIIYRNKKDNKHCSIKNECNELI